MMKPNLALFIFLGMSSCLLNAHDSGNSAPLSLRTSRRPEAEADDRFDKTLRECFAKKDWTKTKVKIVAPDENYLRKWQHPILDDNATRLAASSYDGIDYVISGIRSPFSKNYEYKNAINRMKIFENHITSPARKLSEEDPDLILKRGCMVLCVAASYLKYVDRLDTKYGGLNRSITKGEGVCTEFARFADSLAGRVGISSRIIGTSSHAFVQIYNPTNRKWHYAEPQNKECEYLNPSLSK